MNDPTVKEWRCQDHKDFPFLFKKRVEVLLLVMRRFFSKLPRPLLCIIVNMTI